MAKHLPQQSLADILNNIEKAQAYLGDRSLKEFEEDDVRLDAVLRRLQNASEASTRLRNEWPAYAKDFEARHPDINWVNLRNVGNRYRHYYDNIDAERVYEDLKEFMPRVYDAVTREIPLSRIWAEQHAPPQ